MVEGAVSSPLDAASFSYCLANVENLLRRLVTKVVLDLRGFISISRFPGSGFPSWRDPFPCAQVLVVMRDATGAFGCPGRTFLPISMFLGPTTARAWPLGNVPPITLVGRIKAGCVLPRHSCLAIF